MIERCMTLEPTERPTAQQLMQELEVLSERGRHRPGRARASLDRDAAAQRAKQDPAPASA